MKTLQCILIDDEPLARKGLLEYIADIDFLQPVAEFGAVPPALEFLRSHTVDLIFLDIEMPRMTGLEMLRSVADLPPVIITTAYPQYALEGFEWNVLDYLVKPISFDRFYKSVLRAREMTVSQQDHFFVKVNGQILRVNLAELVFAEAMENYVILQTVDRKLITYLTFKALEEFLPADQFFRIHKSFIVAANKIDSIEGNLIRARGFELPVSRTLKDEVMNRLLNGKYLKRP